MNKRGCQKTASQQVSQSLNQRLTSYALAAGAAGVSLLALAQPADAEIIFTKVNHTIGKNETYDLDLNHDGIPDFTISEGGLPFGRRGAGSPLFDFEQVWVKPLGSNRANCFFDSLGFCQHSYYFYATHAEHLEEAVRTNTGNEAWAEALLRVLSSAASAMDDSRGKLAE